MSWNEHPLNKLIEPAALERAGNRDLPILSMTMHDGLVDQATKFNKRVASADTTAYKVVRRMQLVVGFPIDEGVLSFQDVYDEAIVSPAYDTWELRRDIQVEPAYLERFLRSPHALTFYRTKLRGTTARRRTLPDDIFLKLAVPVPPISEQRRIVELLDNAEALTAKRRAALAQLDTLTQSIFLDMFGDPATNPKGFPIRPLAEFYANLREGTKCGPFGSALKTSELVPSGVPVWNMDNIDPPGRMSLPLRMWITEAKYRELEAYAVIDGDVLISRAGTVGKMCVVRAGFPKSIISTNLIRVRFGPNLLPAYFVSLMTFCRGRVGRLRTGPDGAFTHMSTSILDGLKFPHPPVELQHRFATILELVEQRKCKQRTQLTELDTLFASLQQRSFAGTLFS